MLYRERHTLSILAPSMRGLLPTGFATRLSEVERTGIQLLRKSVKGMKMLQWLDDILWQKQRMIYKYRDGKTIRRGDPLVIYRALKNHQTFNYDEHLTAHDNGDDEATKACAQGTRDAFEIPLFDGKVGLTENELVALLKHFTLYVLDLKKNSSPLPIPAKPTELVFSPCLPCQEASGTKPTADSTSTSEEQNSETQEASQRESVEPST